MKAVGVDVLRVFAVAAACFVVMEGWITAGCMLEARARRRGDHGD